MTTKKWELSRRTFLRGSGYALALPMLEVMQPSVMRALAQGVDPNKIWFSMEMVNGFAPPSGVSVYDGFFGYPRDVMVQNGVADKCLFMHRLARRNSDDHGKILSQAATGNPNGGQGNGHGIPNMTFWNEGPGSLIEVRRTGICNTSYTGPWRWKPTETIQHRVARTVNASAATPLLAVMADRSGDGGSMCFHDNTHNANIMARADGSYVSHYDDPAAVLRMLGGAAPAAPSVPGSSPDAEMLKKRRIIDAVKGDLDRLKNRVSARDRDELTQFADTLSDAERQVSGLPHAPGGGQPIQCGALPDLKQWNTATFHGRYQALKTLMLLGMKCGAFRFVYFRPATEGSNPSGLPNFPGGSSSWHMHGGQYASLRFAQNWILNEYADFVKKVAAITDPNGKSMLDRTLMTFSCANTDGDGHISYNMHMIQSGMGSYLKLGGGVQDMGRTDIQQVLLTHARAFDPNLATWGKYGSNVVAAIKR